MFKRCENLSDLANFPQDVALSVYERPSDTRGAAFFSRLMAKNFSVSGFISYEKTAEEIENLIRDFIPPDLRADVFFKDWIADMAEICRLFCDLQKEDRVSFWLGTKRGCSRYHVDHVPMRLLVTYAGAGTQWLPYDASDWEAYAGGKPNEEICKDETRINFIQNGDVAIFRGGEGGLLHRTPDEALNHSSVFMRLDCAEFQERLRVFNVAP